MSTKHNPVRTIAAIAASLACAVFLSASAAWGAGRPVQFVEGELLVQAKAGAARGKVDKAIAGQGAVAAGEIPQIKVRRIRVPAHALERVKEALSHNPNISFVEENFIAEAVFTPNDDLFPSQWHHTKISSPAGWDLSTGSTTAPIAIIDSGVDPDHLDLAGKLVPGYNFVSGNTDTHDVQGHGTAVAGSAAAATDNIVGVAGVACDNPIMPLVVVSSSGQASYYDIAQAITFAADNGAKVMNISIAGPSSSSTLQNAVNYAWNRGAVIVAAAANYSTSAPYYPAACDHVVAVSATTSSDTLASYSNRGSWVDLAAPGSSIRTTSNGGGYGYKSGTSFASPITAGLAALIMEANPLLTNTQVVDLMTGNADDLGDLGFDNLFAHGRINVHASLLAATEAVPEPDNTPPSAAITDPLEGDVVNGSVTVTVSASDDTNVSRVDLFVDDSLFASDSTVPYSFLWNTAGSADGPHEISAVSHDSAGNSSPADTVNVTVINQPDPPAGPDTSAPSVAITSPREGASTKRNVNVQVAASDNTAVTKVEFYLDGSLAHIVIASYDTYSWRWSTGNATNGDHVISVTAYDAAGNTGSDSVTVTKAASTGGRGKKK